MTNKKIAVLHYSAPPVIGGVEAVIKAQIDQFIRVGYTSTVIAGRGQKNSLPGGANFIEIPEIDSQHPSVTSINQHLERGNVPEEFERLESHLIQVLAPILQEFDHLIIHNVFTKHFNLPLTSALYRLLDDGVVGNTIAWCHDFSWTSPSSSAKLHPGYPWDLLRTKRSDCTYVVVSKERQISLAALFECPVDEIKVIYNGVDPNTLLGISGEGAGLINKFRLLDRDLNILMPVRVTKAKNIEFALKVVKALKNMGWNLMLVVTGPPDPHDQMSMEYYQHLRNLRSELGVLDNMRFVFESGSNPDEPLYIDEQIVGEMYRIFDVMFMPSHREGFGMPVLEAGLAGVLVVGQAVPAAQELAEREAVIFDSNQDPSQVAEKIVQAVTRSPLIRLKRRVRQQFTWQAIFENDIRPILKRGENN